MIQEKCLNCEHSKEMHSEGKYECCKWISAGRLSFGCICKQYIPQLKSEPFDISTEAAFKYGDKFK